VTGVYLTVLLTAIVAGAMLAKRLRIPYPVVFVLGGLAVALIPGIPVVTLEPDLVFLLFLPPLIFGDGWTTDYRSFKRYRGPILSLALGLVVCTSVAVALLTHWMIGIPLAVGFVLGGILSPTDAVATDAIAEEVNLPEPLPTIIGGESLVNDASGLVIYRFALAAVAFGTFSLAAAFAQFVYVVAAGIAIGLGGAWLIAKLMTAIRKKGLSDSLIAVSISLVTPFALYVPAEAVHASGVLAALSGGIYLSRKSSQIFDADSRLAAASVWNLLFFTFNGAAFVLVGLQLRSIVRDLPQHSLLVLVGWGLTVCALLVVVRFAWVFAVTNLRRRLFPKMAEREGAQPWQALVVISFAGMRGIVSLAAALAIPERTESGAPFPDRALILFITFVVILVTLVGEGLTMPWLVRRLGSALATDDGEHDRLLSHARVRTYEAARDHLRSLEPAFTSTGEWEVAGRLGAGYEERMKHFAAHRDGVTGDDDEQQHEIDRRLRREAFAAERRALQRMRRSGEVSDRVYRDLEWDIDLEESRLQ
jgi:monovalent cation/hydrogen antiporter